MEEFKGSKPSVIGQGIWGHHKSNQMPSKDWTVLYFGKWGFCLLFVYRKERLSSVNQ